MPDQTATRAPAGLRAWRRIVGTIGLWSSRRPHPDQRGLSQSTENAVLLTGAVGIAVTVIAVVGQYVTERLSGLR